MKVPHFFLNSKARLFFTLWKQERRANARLRRELIEWQNKLLEREKIRPLFQPPPKPIEQVERPPIGPTAKRLHLAQHQGVKNEPTAEDILAQAARAVNK